MSERLSPPTSSSQSTQSNSHSNEQSKDSAHSISSQILAIVQDNQRMLKSLTSQSPEDLTVRLEEEEKKTKSLSQMLQECIADNDSV